MSVGHGRPVIAMLPPIGHDAPLFAPLARSLEAHAEVVALDLPGFGARESELDEPRWEVLRARCTDDRSRRALLDALVDDAAETLEKLGVDPVIVGGVSLGGTLALPLAARLRRRPSGLLLMASGGRRVARVRRDGVRGEMDALGDVDFALAHLGVSASGDAESAGARTHVAAEGPLVAAYFERFSNDIWGKGDVRAKARAAATLLDAALAVDLGELMAANEIPALVIAGEADRIFGPRTMRRLVDSLASSELRVLSGVGHFPPLEAPDQVAELALSFFSDPLSSVITT